MKKKFFYEKFYFKIIPIFFLGFALGIILIWPGAIFGKSRKCFFNILKDGSDGDAKNKYLKVLLVGDSCFRKF